MKFAIGYWITAAVLAVGGIATMTGAAIYRSVNPDTISFTENFSGFKSMEVDLGYSSLNIRQTAEEECRVECVDVPEEVKVWVDDNTLKIEEENEGRFRLISFGETFSEVGQVIIYLPEEEYKKVEISLGLMAVSSISGLSCNTLKLDAGVGDFILSDITVDEELDLDGGTGDFTMKNVNVSGKCDMDLGTGNFYAQNFDAKKKCELDLGTGDCKLEECTFDGLDLDCGVGEVMLYDIMFKGDADIAQGTGDVELKLRGNPEDYSVITQTGMGDVTIDGRNTSALNNKYGKYTISIDCGVGDVDVTFPEN